jgi:hypothetical protein
MSAPTAVTADTTTNATAATAATDAPTQYPSMVDAHVVKSTQ